MTNSYRSDSDYGHSMRFTDGGHTKRTADDNHSFGRLPEALAATQNVQRRFVRGPADESQDDSAPGLASRIIEQSGGHLGKYEPPVSLSTHIINTVVVGLNAYVYDKIVIHGESTDQEEGRLLMAALALHDANKYVEQEYETDLNTKDNSREVLECYFDQGDDFGIRDVLPGDSKKEIEQDILDVMWLVQRTEATEDSADTRGKSTRRVRGLDRYCRIGDGFVSKVGRDGLSDGCNWMEQWYTQHDTEHVQCLQFTSLEQPILNNHLLSLVKGIVGDGEALDVDVEGEVRGILLGATPNSVAYLGKPVERTTLQSEVEELLMEQITDAHDFDCKTEWRSFEPDILTEVGISLEAKREIIADGYAETLAGGSGTDHEFERVPEDYRQYLPELAQLVFETKEFDSTFEGLSQLPRLREQVLESDDYNNQTWKIGFLAELLRRYMGTVDDGYDPETLEQELETVRERTRPELEAVLQPEANAGAEAVGRFFQGGTMPPAEPPSSGNMCFLCGRPAETEYKKGRDAFYGTNKFSRRVPPEGQYKRICPVCNLEHALLKDSCESRDARVGDDTEIAYIYYDEFLAGLNIGQHTVYDLTDDESGYDVADPDLVASSMQPQYHLQPFYSGGENGRLAAIRSFLDEIVANGLKVVVGKPFTTFRSGDGLLTDLNPVRRQVGFGANKIRTAEERRRVSALFDLLGQVAGDSEQLDASNAFTSVPDDSFRELADLVVQHTDWYSNIREQAHNYFRRYDPDSYMLMRNVAQEGLNLYGEQYDSTHKKTKIFREAIDATLDGLSRGKTDSELHEHVAGQVYKTASTEQYAPRTTTEKAEQFVDSLFSYLKEEDSFDKAALSRRRNTLTNTYLFAYDQLLNELQEDQQQEA